MPMRSLSLNRPRRKGMHFMLIPLIDVIFLLITFFMLSSNLAAYSALSLGDYRRESDASAVTSEAAAAAAQPDLLLTVSSGEVRANGTLMPLAAFADEAARLKEAGARRAVVFVRPSATTQDIVTVLEVLKRTAFAAVSVRTRQAG
jgi:biopolymer transport protein ExbD